VPVFLERKRENARKKESEMNTEQHKGRGEISLSLSVKARDIQRHALFRVGGETSQLRVFKRVSMC